MLLSDWTHDWRAVLVIEGARQRVREDLVPGLGAGLGALLGVVLASSMLVIAGAPGSPLPPVSGVRLLLRLALVVPVPAWFCARFGLALGVRLLARLS